MTTTPKALNEDALPASWTTFYTVPSATKSDLVFLNFYNSNTAGVTVQVRVQNAAASQNYQVTKITIDPEGTGQWAGLITIDEVSAVLQHIASTASGISQTGSLREYT